MSDRISPDRNDPRTLDEEAALWFARMRGPEAEGHRPNFEAWLSRGALHLGAYNRAAEVFSLGKFLTSELSPEPAIPTNVATAGHRTSPLWWPPLLAACALAILCWAVLARGSYGVTSPTGQVAATSENHERVRTEFSTGAQDNRTIDLDDGSTVTLAPSSRLLVSFQNDRRSLWLEQGRARFEVAHDARPFIVSAGGGSVTARGTIFEVTVGRGDRIEVKLLRGSVDVAMPAPATAASATKRLSPGESVTFRSAAATGPTPADTATLTESSHDGASNIASRSAVGMREVDGLRVAELVAEANESEPTVRIRLADPVIGNRRVSGRFRTTDPELLAQRLAAMFDLKIDRSMPAVIILRDSRGT